MIVFDNNIEYLLAFISAILGVSVPLMLQVIERVDQRYESTRLAKRLQTEGRIRACIISLIAAIVSCTYNLFFRIPSPYDCWLLNNSANLIAALCCVILIITFLASCRIILIYYNPETLQDRILAKYEQAKDNSEKERYFWDWVDLTKALLQSSDKGLARKVYSVIDKEISAAFDAAGKNGVAFPSYLSFGILSINENLCLMQRHPFSINNGNQLLKLLISQPSKLNDESYLLLWNNLQLQLSYNQEDWVYEYWSAAVQVYDLDLREMHEGIPDYTDSEQLVTKEDAEKRRRDRRRFWEFHIMLCADILRKERYGLLENIMGYIRSMTPEYDYPLIPSSFEEILNAFKIIDDSPRLDFGAEKFYPIRDEKGIVDGIIQGSGKRYLTFLYVRMFANIGRTTHLRLNYPDTLGELKRMEDSIDYISQNLPRIFGNDKLMDILSFTNFDEEKRKMEEELGKVKDEIKSKQEKVRISGELSDDIIGENLNTAKVTAVRKLKDYEDFVFESSEGDRSKYYLNGNVSCLYPNEAFQEDTGICYANMAETTTASALIQFQHGFASIFFRKNRKRYRINNDDALKAIERLAIGEDFVIVSFDIWWDYYLQNEGVTKNDNGQYFYKGVHIISLSAGPSDALSQTFFVMRQTDIPQIQFIKPLQDQIDKYNLKELENKYELYGNIIKLSENKALLDETDKLSRDEAEKHASFYIFINAIMLWKDSAPIVSIKLLYGLKDNGMPDTLETFHSFEKMFDK